MDGTSILVATVLSVVRIEYDVLDFDWTSTNLKPGLLNIAWFNNTNKAVLFKERTINIMMNNTAQPDFATPEKQEDRSFLRERFLRVITSITDKECKLNLYDKTSVTATFGGTDLDIMKLYIRDLKTPMFTHSHALVRTSDILSIEVPNASYQKLIKSQLEEQNCSDKLES